MDFLLVTHLVVFQFCTPTNVKNGHNIPDSQCLTDILFKNPTRVLYRRPRGCDRMHSAADQHGRRGGGGLHDARPAPGEGVLPAQYSSYQVGATPVM